MEVTLSLWRVQPETPLGEVHFTQAKLVELFTEQSRMFLTKCPSSEAIIGIHELFCLFLISKKES
jgi:hypothetical protein